MSVKNRILLLKVEKEKILTLPGDVNHRIVVYQLFFFLAVDLMELVFWALDLKTDLLYLVVVTQRLEITSAWGK